MGPRHIGARCAPDGARSARGVLLPRPERRRGRARRATLGAGDPGVVQPGDGSARQERRSDHVVQLQPPLRSTQR